MKRRVGEPFAAYKRRRKLMDLELKRRLRGTLFWDSWFWGTYKRGMTPPIQQEEEYVADNQKGIILGPDGKPISTGRL